MWVTTQSCPKLSSLRLLTNTLRNFFLKDSLQNPRKTTNVPHTNVNQENGHGMKIEHNFVDSSIVNYCELKTIPTSHNNRTI